MSRCFPYPPPGYVRNGVRDEALIESIKLQGEGEKAKKERKKEKKQEKKEKEKALKNGEIDKKKRRHKRKCKEEMSQEDQKGGDLQKRGENETEHLEKSSLTEEHGHPVSSQNSSDSTLNSNKRRKQSSPPDCSHNPGSVLRIRLPLQRHTDPEVLPSKEQLCFALGRTDDSFVQEVFEPAPRPGRDSGKHSCSTSQNAVQELTFRLSKEKPRPSSGASNRKEKPCPSSGASKVFAHMAETAPPPSVSGSGSSSLASQFGDSIVNRVLPQPNVSGSGSSSLAAQLGDSIANWVPPQPNVSGSGSPSLASQVGDLIANWVPPLMQSEFTEFDDQEWLFETKQNHNRGVERGEVGSDGLSYQNSTPWPCAQYLPMADIYALPFTVPF